MSKRKPLTPEEAGHELREARLEAGLTQAEVAEEIGLPRGQTEVSEIERTGKHVKYYWIVRDFRRAVSLE